MPCILRTAPLGTARRRLAQGSSFATFASSWRFYQEAARRFVDGYRGVASNPSGSIGHWVGMATHDVGSYESPLVPGTVFTIEPALVVPAEKIYVCLEDLILITDTGKEVPSAFVPMDIDGIERLMAEPGMLQRYSRDLPKS